MASNPREAAEPAARLREARIAAGFSSAAEAARQFGWTEATYRHHENGTRRFDRDFAVRYARVFRVSSAWLAGWSDIRTREYFDDAREEAKEIILEGQPYTAVADGIFAETGLVLIQVVMINFFDTFGVSFGEYQPEYIALMEESVAKLYEADPSDLIGIKVEGDSMAPTLTSDSVVLVDRACTSIEADDDIWLISFQNRTSLCRIKRLSRTSLWLSTDNDGASGINAATYDVHIRGRVVWRGQSLKRYKTD